MPRITVSTDRDMARDQYMVRTDVSAFDFTFVMPREIMYDLPREYQSSERLSDELRTMIQRAIEELPHRVFEEFQTRLRRATVENLRPAPRNIPAPSAAEIRARVDQRQAFREALFDGPGVTFPVPSSGNIIGRRNLSGPQPQTPPRTPTRSQAPEGRRLDIDQFEAEADAVVTASQRARRRLEDLE